jgi:2-methylcitrate dehydratase PrpD
MTAEVNTMMDSRLSGQTTVLTRRDVLGYSGLMVAGAAIPPGTASVAAAMAYDTSVPDVSPVMETLSSYMGAAAGRVLPDDVIEKTKEHVLDTLAAMISGSELPPGRAALQFCRQYGGKALVTIVATDVLSGPMDAAFANGMLAHADETDDSHAASQSHPGCAVVPAALATGELFGISGAHFLRAVILGYDIGTRVTMALGGQHFEAESHWSTHSIAPMFGAAAAAGCAAGCSSERMRWMFGYAAHQSSGLAAWSRDTEHLQKAFHFGGMTARAGVTAALLVHSGWTGVGDILSGKDNLFSAYNPHADPAGLTAGLGERFEVMRTNIKKWPVGSPIQAALDGLERLRAQRPFQASQVRKIVVRMATDEAAIVNNREIPDICLQHVIAVALLDMTVTFSSVHDRARLSDPATLRARATVQLTPDDDLQRLMPLRVAIVEVTLIDGSRLRARIDDVRGTPRNPMSRQEVVAKSTDLIAPVLGSAKCSSLIRGVLQLESSGDIRELRPLLQRS